MLPCIGNLSSLDAANDANQHFVVISQRLPLFSPSKLLLFLLRSTMSIKRSSDARQDTCTDIPMPILKGFAPELSSLHQCFLETGKITTRLENLHDSCAQDALDETHLVSTTPMPSFRVTVSLRRLQISSRSPACLVPRPPFYEIILPKLMYASSAWPFSQAD